MDILINKYYMFDNNISGSPQVARESTNKSFKDIFELIKKINPYDNTFIAKRYKKTK